MAIIARKEKSNFTPAPTGLWPGVCCDVVDIGIVPTQWGPKHKVQIKFLVDAKPIREDGKPHMVSKKYTLSLHEKANLRLMLEVWRGRKFTDQELDGFDLEALVSAPCQVQVAHGEGDDGPFAFPQVVLKVNGSKRVEVKGYTRVKDRPDYKPPQTETVEEEYEPEISEDDIPF